MTDPSRTLEGIPGNALRVFLGLCRIFPEFLLESPSRTGVVGHQKHAIWLRLRFVIRIADRKSPAISDSGGRCPATSAWFPPGNVLARLIVWHKCLLCCASMFWLDVCSDSLWCLLCYLRSCRVISERLSAGTKLLGFSSCVG